MVSDPLELELQLGGMVGPKPRSSAKTVSVPAEPPSFQSSSETFYSVKFFKTPHILFSPIWGHDPQLKNLGSVWFELVAGLVCSVRL